jgi:hypothetical protein
MTFILSFLLFQRFKPVVQRAGGTAHWEGQWDLVGGAKRQGGWQRELDMGPSERVLCLFTSAVTLDETLRNRCNFKTIHFIKNLLTLK